MILINIVEYDSGLGAMTSIAGIEDGKNFLVQKNIALNKKNEFIYNNNHFLDHYIDYDPGDYSIDLFIASPFFGDKIQKRGASNFETNELNECLAYISLKLPPYILIVVYGSAIPFLQIDSKVNKTYDGIPTNDIIIGKIKEMGYDAQNIVFDMSQYRLPQRKIISLYYFWKKGDSVDPIKMPDPKTFKTDECVGKWLDQCRNISYFGKKDWSKKDVCSKIKQGSNALKTKSISITKGYTRIKYDDKTTNDLGVDFYKVSGSGPCIHPVEDRPLTIEEGALLSGLSMDYLYNKDLSKKEMASMINRAVSPIIGSKIREGLLNSIK